MLCSHWWKAIVSGLSANRKLRLEKQPRGIGNDRSGFRHVRLDDGLFGSIME